ncbi:hypothetical protein LIER_37051 [Lithospermum erythrorhizon]|uniref:Uncharacterized protein n=1 Tax=Lithospermum erythrorhizon TaxID=34254 RepID=A0AAV3PED3_LITER
MNIKGIDFASDENEDRWNFVCARNIFAERYLSEATVKNQTYMDILDESEIKALPLTITDKLVSGKRVVDVEVKGAGQFAAVPEGAAAALLIKAYEEEQKVMEADIRLKKNRVSELKAKIQALQTTVPLAVNDSVDVDNKAAAPDIAKPVDDPPSVNAPTFDVAEVLDETPPSHV